MKLYLFVLLVALATIAWAQEDVQLDEAPQNVNDFDGVRVARSPNRYYTNPYVRPHNNQYYGPGYNRPHGGGHHQPYRPQHHPNRYIG